MKKTDRIINILKEMVGNAPGQSGAFTSNANAAGPVAGFDPIQMFQRRRKNGDFDYRSVDKEYRRWLKSVKDIVE